MFVRSLCGSAVSAARYSSRSAVMPLKAKVINPAFVARAQMSSSSRRDRDQEESSPAAPSIAIKELPGDEPEDVLFNTLFGVRTIELNRPSKLHSLNGSMIRKIVPRLQEWAKSDMANVVIIKGSGPKAFCAGGDVAALAEDNITGEEGQQKSTDYFGLEYKLDHLIATYQKPYVAFMDGITMGGGVGLSVHAPFRIATERTVFAMPETTIGFFPDVGVSFFLPKMPGGVGTYLALTSERLKGVNVFYAGVATHYVHSTSLPALERRLAELRFKDYDSMPERLDLINSTIEEFCTGLPHDEPMLIQGELRRAIDRCFGQTSVPAIIQALQAEEGETKEWAEKTLASLHKRSPTSVYVTLRQMQIAQNWSISETFKREYQMAAKFMRNPDFTEGVHALLIHKHGKPAWKPASLEDIKAKDNIADPFFEEDPSLSLDLLTSNDYSEYPHARFNLPTERQVESMVKSLMLSPREIVRRFVDTRKGKQGVKEIVQEVLDRKTRVDHNEKAVWEVSESTPTETTTAESTQPEPTKDEQ